MIITWFWGVVGRASRSVQPKFYFNVPLVSISTAWFSNPHTTGSLPEAELFSRLLIKLLLVVLPGVGLCLPSGVTAAHQLAQVSFLSNFTSQFTD